MCGRARQVLDWQDMKIKWWTDQRIMNSRARWNAAPRQDLVVIRRHGEESPAEALTMNWGLIPYWEKDAKGGRRPINAMSEKATSGMWRDAFKRRRCLIPVNGFYEWKKVEAGKQPYSIDRADGEIMMLAGVWDRWKSPDGDELTTFAIMTCEPNDVMANIHNRMPVVIARGDYDAWLHGTPENAAKLLTKCSSEDLKIYRVSERVGNVRNDDPDIMVYSAAEAMVEPKNPDGEGVNPE